ncbi:MAG: asparagine synthase (glutamine-hydrolyzing) [Ferruginibacter sp.]|nr:asparagine synthase (glutamine-hydrolyzing) [Ferruginibacter sp.]
MCRIAGVLNKKLDTLQLETIVGKMCQLLQHGGPDDGGIATFKNDNLVLGNRRLSLLDLTTAGHQPMQFTDRYTITFNGELYNYLDLKAELIAEGLQFKTNTDTEVVLAAFAKWNTKSFAKFNGMFAFALWDNEEKIIYLVRDAAGIKPLYYSTHTTALAFASEIRAFAPLEYLSTKNENASVFQLAYGYIPEPVTTLKNVQCLPKGCYYKYNANTNKGNLFSFNYFSFGNKINSEIDAKQIIHKSLNNAVQRQMIADAPVGVFLSGGIDSAIIANLASSNSKKNVHTLSIYFNEENYSEKKYQDIVAQKIGSNHHSILLTENEFHANFADFMVAMDMPTCDGINTWFISKFAANEGLKAVLSGVGADELFGGYPSFDRIKKAKILAKLPKAVLLGLGNINNKKLARLSYLKLGGIRGLYLFLRGHFNTKQIAQQLGAYEKDVWNIIQNMPTSPILENCEAKNTASWLEYNLYMQDQLLKDADIMSMAHGLEIRVPFLDNEVIESVFSINENIKYAGKMPKQLLIKSFENILPKEVWNRPKMGFSFPFAEWMKNSEFVNELSHNNNNDYTKKACQDFLSGTLHWSRIMSLIVLKNKNLI